jgi:hypothetical protein
MVFPSHGNHFSREFVLVRNSQIGRRFRNIASRKRLRRIPREASREVMMRTWLLLVIRGREKERVLERRVTVMEDHRS